MKARVTVTLEVRHPRPAGQGDRGRAEIARRRRRRQRAPGQGVRHRARGRRPRPRRGRPQGGGREASGQHGDRELSNRGGRMSATASAEFSSLPLVPSPLAGEGSSVRAANSDGCRGGGVSALEQHPLTHSFAGECCGSPLAARGRAALSNRSPQWRDARRDEIRRPRLSRHQSRARHGAHAAGSCPAASRRWCGTPRPRCRPAPTSW